MKEDVGVVSVLFFLSVGEVW